MKFVAFVILAMFMCSCISAQPVSPNRKIHPEFSDLDDLEMMLLNDHETIYENKSEQRRLLSNNSFQQQNIRIGMARRNVQMQLGHAPHSLRRCWLWIRCSGRLAISARALTRMCGGMQ